VVKATPRLLYLREREPVHIVQDTGWDPGPVWTNAEKSRFTGKSKQVGTINFDGA